MSGFAQQRGRAGAEMQRLLAASRVAACAEWLAEADEDAAGLLLLLSMERLSRDDEDSQYDSGTHVSGADEFSLRADRLARSARCLKRVRL